MGVVLIAVMFDVMIDETMTVVIGTGILNRHPLITIIEIGNKVRFLVGMTIVGIMTGDEMIITVGAVHRLVVDNFVCKKCITKLDRRHRQGREGMSVASALPTFKLLLMGDSGTGKSSLLLRFTDDKFLGEDVQTATIGSGN